MRTVVLALALASSAVAAAPVALAGDPVDLDRQLEDVLARGEVVAREPVGQGVTHPERLTLRLGDVQLRAIFKTVDEEVNDLAYGERWEMNFTDRWTYEVAAYRLDRLLGLRLVPVTVPRTIDGRKGSVQAWIEDAIDLESAVQKNTLPRGREKFLEHKAAMAVLDALTYNTDRNAGNVLLTPGDEGFYAIDYTRAFRMDHAFPAFLKEWNLPYPPGLLDRLRAITRADLDRIFEGLLSKAQVTAVDKRRALLIKKLEKVAKP